MPTAAIRCGDRSHVRRCRLRLLFLVRLPRSGYRDGNNRTAVNGGRSGVPACQTTSSAEDRPAAPLSDSGAPKGHQQIEAARGAADDSHEHAEGFDVEISFFAAQLTLGDQHDGAEVEQADAQRRHERRHVVVGICVLPIEEGAGRGAEGGVITSTT